MTISEGANYASIGGFIISIIGFGVTGYNAWKARIEVNNLRRDISKIDIVHYLSTAIATMEEVQRLHRICNWPLLPDRYSRLKECLILIKGLGLGLSSDYKTRLQGAIAAITSLEELIEKVLVRGDSQVNIPYMNGVVLNHIDSLRLVLVGVKSEIGGHNG